MLGGKFIKLSVYIVKKDKSKLNNLITTLRNERRKSNLSIKKKRIKKLEQISMKLKTWN